MEEKQDLGRLERKLHADMQSSGLFELTFGLLLLAAGVMVVTNASLAMLPLVVLVVPLVRLARVRLVDPRVGSFRLKTSTRQKATVRKVSTIAVGLMILLVAITVYGGEAAEWMLVYFDVIFLGLIAGQLLLWGFWLPYRPYAVEGVLSVILLVLRVVLPLPPLVAWLGVGGMMAMGGLYRFLIFLRDNPVHPAEDFMTDE